MNSATTPLALDRRSDALKALLEEVARHSLADAGSGMPAPSRMQDGRGEPGAALDNHVRAVPADIVEMSQGSYTVYARMSALDEVADRVYGKPREKVDIVWRWAIVWSLAATIAFGALAFAGYKALPSSATVGGFFAFAGIVIAGYKVLIPLVLDARWWLTTSARWIFRRRVIERSYAFNPAVVIYVRYDDKVHALPPEPKLFGYSQANHATRES